MWDQIKKKLRQLFMEDSTEEESQTNLPPYSRNKSHIDNKNIHTKMSYQYPSKRPFQFPVIPDRQVPTRSQKEEPAFERKQKAQEKNAPKRNGAEYHKTDEKEQNEEQNKEPFKASDVPSPIYGFQRRNKEKKEIEDVPAYIRKEASFAQLKQESVSNEKLELNDRDLRDTDQQTHVEQQPLTENKETNEKARDEISPTRQTEQPSKMADGNEDTGAFIPFRENNHSEPAQQEEENNKVITFETNNEKKENKTRAERRSERSDTSTSNNEQKSYKENSQRKQKSVPFNVIMTPRDKKTRFDKEAGERNKPAAKSEETDVRPPLYLLNDPVNKTNKDNEWVEQQIELLETTLKHFHVKANVVNATRGPSVTRFEVHPELGVKVSKVKNLSDDIKLNMAAKDIRMEAPIPGKNTIGIEVPNPESQPVGLQEILQSEAFREDSSPLTVALGLDIAGNPVVTNLQKMPHGLIAGATGSGKSVCINTILLSLLYKASYEEVKFLLIDPKMVELAPYNEIPHLVSPVITDVKAATSALKWAVREMEERYEKFVQEKTRDVERYNQKMVKEGRSEEKLPYLVIVIDELADLMMVSPQDVEDAICRIAQKARACGIHLLVATQRPSVDVITGLIKANIPTRAAFSVSSQVDSRTIIDTNGAEKLLGKGDMLFVENGKGQSVRIQGSFVSDDEIERIANYVKKTAPPQYLFEQEQLLEQVHTEEEEDELYTEAVEFVVNQNGASSSLLQRKFKIGYNRAARLIDSMETNGIISEQKGSKPRDVLLSSNQVSE